MDILQTIYREIVEGNQVAARDAVQVAIDAEYCR